MSAGYFKNDKMKNIMKSQQTSGVKSLVLDRAPTQGSFRIGSGMSHISATPGYQDLVLMFAAKRSKIYI